MMTNLIDQSNCGGVPRSPSELQSMVTGDLSRVQRICCLADADRWIEQELDGKGVARVTNAYSLTPKLTIYVPTIDPIARETFEEELSNIASILLTIVIEAGRIKYYWNQLFRWVYGR